MNRSPADALVEFVDRLRASAESARHRRLLVLAGRPDWGRERAAAVIAGLESEKSLWVGREAPGGIPSVTPDRAVKYLGREFEAVVIDAFSGFDVDAFGAVSGTVRRGGLLVLITPPLEKWPRFPDPEHARIAVYPSPPEAVTGRFLARLVGVLRRAGGTAVVEEGRPLPSLPPQEAAEEPATPSPDPVCATADQAVAVEAILRVVTGHRRRPLVLTSDRGRGKSAALGIAAARLLARGVDAVLVTGPRLDSVAPVFEHAARLLPSARLGAGQLEWEGKRLEFAPPDELALDPRPAGLLLVDEAAAIPAPLLEALLAHYSRIAFATTVHGYEGTGRGFAVRFQRTLDARTPHWKALHLTRPIRWADGDPVERFVFRALALDASAAPDDIAAQASPDTCLLERLDRDALLTDETTLSELFGLLVLAHYRTRPLDLRHLFDGPNLTLWVMRHAGHVVGTALVAAEGGFDAPTARGVWEGRIRPHGHLLPESLAAHLGLEAAPRLRSERIMRIAVHPAARNRGLGTRLVGAVLARAADEGRDLVGSSFGATEDLLAFWERNGHRPVRVSLKRGAASGAHSVMVLHPLTTAGEALYRAARARFAELLPHLLADPLRDLEPSLAARLFAADRPRPPELDAQEWRDLVAFAYGRRVFEVALAPIWKLTLAALADPRAAALMPSSERAALIGKVLQKRDYADVARTAGLTGRAEVVQAMRRALRPLVAHYGEPWVQAEAQALAAVWREEGES